MKVNTKEYIKYDKYIKQEKKQKPSKAWQEYCIGQQEKGKCEIIQCLMIYLKGKLCKDKWIDKHCDLKRGKK